MNAGLLEMWRIWDFIYQHSTRLEYVDKENGNIFRVVFCRYRGPVLVTKDGQEIKHGDPIVKLHIHNWKLTYMLKGIDNEARLGLKTLRIVKESLPGLALFIQQHSKGLEAKAIIGTTFLHRGVKRLGFTVEYVPDNLKFKIKNFNLRILLLLIHPSGYQRLKLRREELTLKRVYMSKQQLYSDYAYQKALEEQV